MLYFWKEKHMEIALFYTCVPKILMMWSIVLEIECDSKNQNFEKMKKIAGDIIILHICTKNHNHNHMRYNSWDREWDRQNYLSFWAIFWPFTPLTIQKIKIFKKWKKHQMWSFYTCIPEIMIIWCMFPEIWSVTDIIFCHFGRFFCTLAILTTWIIQFFKKWKKKKKKPPGDSTILPLCNTNYYHMMYGLWDMEHNFFYPFTPPPQTTWNIDILKKRKKYPKILSFHTCGAWQTEFFLAFWIIFTFLSP